ncbi:type IV pilus biogenesis protein PilM [Desulfolucanica intricata]|uniref:type IV pilus biogenesis protein PilM n=1 Tax=Desulfolucanica intricata TaxID=1285191 RepID=UPI000831EC6E|nr:pilus assembly protein PilM [Desulfolucanica intricata]
MFLKDKLFSSLFIDIRGELIRVVQGRPMDNNLNFVVDGFGSLFLPGHLQQEGGEQLAANADRLKQFLKEKNMKATKVVAGLGQNGVITRNVRVPKMSLKDLDSMMKLNINDYLPVSTGEYSFDYKVLHEVEEDGLEKLELLVAAVNRKQVEQCALLLEKAGLKPVVFDILPNMLHRLFEHLVYRDTLVVDSGAEGTHIAIFKGKDLFIYVDIPFVFNAEGDNDFSVLVREMSGYLDYFSSRNFGKTVDGITVVGEMAACPGLAEILGQVIVIPVTVGLSLAGPLGFKGKAADFSKQAAVYAGNLGLMMRDRFLPSKAAPVTPGIPASSKETFGT